MPPWTGGPRSCHACLTGRQGNTVFIGWIATPSCAFNPGVTLFRRKRIKEPHVGNGHTGPAPTEAAGSTRNGDRPPLVLQLLGQASQMRCTVHVGSSNCAQWDHKSSTGRRRAGGDAECRSHRCQPIVASQRPEALFISYLIRASALRTLTVTKERLK